MGIANMAMSIGIALDPSGKAQKQFEKELRSTMTEPESKPTGPVVRRPRFLKTGPGAKEPLKHGKKKNYRSRGVRAKPSAKSEAMFRRMQGLE